MMRLAVMIIGLLLGLVMFIQAFLINILGDLGDDEELSGAGAVGLLVAIFWLVACALVIAFPLASTVILVLAGLMAFAISGEYPDMAVWGVISLVLAVMSYFGWRGKKADAAKQRERERRDLERDELLRNALQSQGQQPTGTQPSQTITCPSCGASGLASSTRFCPNCGLQRTEGLA